MSTHAITTTLEIEEGHKDEATGKWSVTNFYEAEVRWNLTLDSDGYDAEVVGVRPINCTPLEDAYDLFKSHQETQHATPQMLEWLNQIEAAIESEFMERESDLVEEFIRNEQGEANEHGRRDYMAGVA